MSDSLFGRLTTHICPFDAYTLEHAHAHASIYCCLQPQFAWIERRRRHTWIEWSRFSYFFSYSLPCVYNVSIFTLKIAMFYNYGVISSFFFLSIIVASRRTENSLNLTQFNTVWSDITGWVAVHNFLHTWDPNESTCVITLLT